MRKLRKYQVQMLDYCMNVQHPALFVQMRLGKTIVTIRSLKLRGAEKVLIVAPYSALYSWRDELELENISNIREIFGKREERLSCIEHVEPGFYLLNKEGHRSVPEVADIHWDAVVLDESYFIHAPKSAAAEFYIENFRDAEYRYILTGTPAPETELNYYNQVKFLSHRYWKESNYWKFRHNNFAMINFDAVLKPSGSKYIMRNLARRCFYLSRSDVNLGGEKVYEKRFVQMTGKVRAIYERVEKEFILEYLGLKQETIYAPTKYIWLRRLCGGFADQEFISYAKMKELKSLIDIELKKEPTIILCKHVNEVQKVSKYLSKYYKVGMIYGAVDKKKERPRIIREFQEGKLDHIVAQPETIKHGINLSRSDVVIFYTSPDGGETRTQVEDRVVNTATNDSSLIIDLVCRGTVEEDVLKSIQSKDSNQAMMKKMVQRLQKKYNLKGVQDASV